jgi:uncharacterized caspase-like protein
MVERVALLVGTDFFQDDRFSRLLAPKEDVLALREALLDPAVGGFKEVNLVFNSDLVAVQRAIHDLVDARAPDDLILFYYSGHGLTDLRGRLYFALHTSSASRPAIGSLPAEFVRACLNDSAARRQVVLLDCCHSGAFLPNSKRAKGEPVVTKETFDPEGYGRYVMTACTATEFAFEGGSLYEGDLNARPRSVFTHELVRVLCSGEAADPGRSVVTFEGLYRCVRARVRQAHALMDPQRWADPEAGDLVFARSPRVQAVLPEHLIAALANEDRLVRLGAVAELANIINQRPGSAEASAAFIALRAREDFEDSRVVLVDITRALREAEEQAKRMLLAAPNDKTVAVPAAIAEAQVNAQNDPKWTLRSNNTEAEKVRVLRNRVNSAIVVAFLSIVASVLVYNYRLNSIAPMSTPEGNQSSTNAPASISTARPPIAGFD